MFRNTTVLTTLLRISTGTRNMASAAAGVAEAAAVEIDVTRKRIITDVTEPIVDRKTVVYWMSREQRAEDNWALLHAVQLASELGDGAIVKVVFNLVPKFLEATLRQYGFMIAGLKETEAALREKHIPMILLKGWPSVTLPEFVAREKPAAVVTDMAPLRVPAGWVTDVAAALDLLLPPVPLVQVDAHNIVPVWVASDKQEVGARTIRRKINDRLPQYFTDFPALPPNPPSTPLPPAIEWDAELAALQIDRTVPEVDWLVPGAAAAQRVLDQFIAERLNVYHDLSNNPNESAQSDLSPYLHFGQLAPQRAALTIKHCTAHAAGKKAFLEQTIVRREVTDNYCFYNKHYDSLDGAAVWARDSLLLHASDKREYVYNREQLDRAKTHDPLWNAAQRQLLQTGKMHGFMRMYWAKKILEWSADPATALADAIYLNDRYNLDGRDPNGYVGCMWSICGIHDMGWKERPVFGKIRYMNYAGCKRKFKVAQFENRYPASKSGGLTKLFQKGEAGAGAATEGRKRKSSKAAATGGTAKKSK